MVEIAGGVFIDDWDGPGVEHTIGDLLIDRTEVTASQYSACVAAQACTSPAAPVFCNNGPSGTGDRPVACVDWSQATAYCAWRGARLPTEWEWEWVARGREETRLFPWGDTPDPTCAHAVLSEANSGQLPGCDTGETWVVGSKPDGASRDGVLNLAGNVMEWTSSLYDSENGSARTVRGGSYFSSNFASDWFLAKERRSADVSVTVHDLGFRCAKSLP